ncbi:PH domain-containing protein [Indiicoccus explosivorum]|uniref:PH domain-containing protein n=1 Tax=Indiicoccus explosivorum TaxID=1917864 RepID=UPI0013900D06|nr:PH domain-containing protein [Indiicoccus explosivorum]
MSSKFTKLNYRYGVMEFPLTVSELKGVTKDIPKTERTYYEYTLKAIKKYVKDNENIYYLTVGGAKLLKPSGFVLVADSGLILTWLKGGMFGGAEAEKIEYNSIKNVDFDILPGGSSSFKGGSLLLEISGLMGTKKKTVRDIEENDLDTLVDVLRNRISLSKGNGKLSPEKNDAEFFFGSDPNEEETKIISSHTLAASRIRAKHIENDESIRAVVPVLFDVPKGKQVKGLLVATNLKLIFFSETVFKEFVHTRQLDQINDISQNGKELIVKSDEGVLKYELQNDQNDVRERLVTAISAPSPVPEVVSETITENPDPEESMTPPPAPDKFQQLKQLGELRDSGILTEEEFQAEKAKLLNS